MRALFLFDCVFSLKVLVSAKALQEKQRAKAFAGFACVFIVFSYSEAIAPCAPSFCLSPQNMCFQRFLMVFLIFERARLARLVFQ